MKINKYPDGTSYVILNDYYTSDWITFKVNTYEDLHHLEQFIEAYNFKFKTAPDILIPNLIDAQADRRFSDNQSSGLKIICKRLNSMDANFKIFHPHNPEVVEALMDNVEIFDNSKFIFEVIYGNLFISSGKPTVEQEKELILMSSDAGGFKPLMKLCDKLNWKGETYSASKFRNTSISDKTTTLTQQIGREDFKGKDVLIIDDISVYGGTFKGLAKMLKERNVGKLYLAVSHMTVQELGKDPVTNYFDKVFTTNSKFDKYYWDGNSSVPNLEIINLF